MYIHVRVLVHSKCDAPAGGAGRAGAGSPRTCGSRCCSSGSASWLLAGWSISQSIDRIAQLCMVVMVVGRDGRVCHIRRRLFIKPRQDEYGRSIATLSVCLPASRTSRVGRRLCSSNKTTTTTMRWMNRCWGRDGSTDRRLNGASSPPPPSSRRQGLFVLQLRPLCLYGPCVCRSID